MIAEINTKIENNITPEFIQVFIWQKYLVVNKTSKLFKCSLKLIFNDIKEEIEEYSTENIDKNTEKNLEDYLNSYFEVKEDDDYDDDYKDNHNDNKENDKKIINKDNLLSVIKWFIALVLFREDDKKNKIKLNKKNIINHLVQEDLWNKEIYKDENFNKDLNNLKKFDIQINRIIWFYDYLNENDEEDNYRKNIEDYKKRKKIRMDVK